MRHPPILTLLAITALCAATPTVSHGQPSLVPPLTRGDRIELKWRGTTALTASFLSATRDTVWVRYPSSPDSAAVSRADLQSLRVYRGQRRGIGRHAWRGFLIGAGLGATLGVALAAFGDKESTDYFGGPVGITAFMAGFFAAPGTILGGLLGISYEHWEPVPLH